MTIAVLSDLHLGRGDALDRFGREDDRFLGLLSFLERHHERIVLLGDIFETLDGPAPNHPEALLRASANAHRALVRRLMSPAYQWVVGNHDRVAGSMLGARNDWLVEDHGLRLYFTHGHLGDPIYAKARRWAEVAVWLGGWIRRLGGRALFRLFERMDVALSGVRPDALSCPFRQWAVAEARRRSADVVVTGHSHAGGLSRHGRNLFLNAGACIDGGASFLSIDTREMRFEYHVAWSGLAPEGPGPGDGARSIVPARGSAGADGQGPGMPRNAD